MLVGDRHGTFVILPPLKFAKRLSARVSTLALRWMVNLFEAVTIFLHLQKKTLKLISKQYINNTDSYFYPVKHLTWCICRRFLHPTVLALQTVPEPLRRWEQSTWKEKQIF